MLLCKSFRALNPNGKKSLILKNYKPYHFVKNNVRKSNRVWTLGFLRQNDASYIGIARYGRRENVLRNNNGRKRIRKDYLFFARPIDLHGFMCLKYGQRTIYPQLKDFFFV